ncbi:MAG: ABC transporter substrate-binding protein, partial [Campylobacterota bacterium]|nr:ABC transporter substrate-binding protein [Campylobacterota bacterium]
MKIRNFIILFVLLNSIILNANQKLEKVSLQLHWKYQFEFAGFIAAKEKGFYRDAGLDVELKEYKHGTNIIDEVLNGDSNYGIYNSNIVVEYLKNRPIKLISSYFKRSALVLITKPEIKYPKDLIGKKIMASTKKDFDLNFNYIFNLQDIDTNDLNFVPHTFNIKDFVDGKVDAMTAFISDQPYKLDKLNIKYNIINPSDYGIFNLQLELFTSTNESNKYRARTEAFKKASIKGWIYALEHKDEIIDIIHKKYSPDITIDFLKNESKITERLILPKMYKVGSIDKMFLNRQLDMFKQISNSENETLINDFIFYNQQEIDNKKLNINYTLLWQIFIVILIIIAIILYRQRLLNRYNIKLKDSINKATKELEESEKELQILNENLEKEIELKTHELRDSLNFMNSLVDSVIFGVVQSEMDGRC